MDPKMLSCDTNKNISDLTKSIAFADGKINLVPNNKTLDWSKLKGLADDKLLAAQMVKSVFHRAENIEGKGENASYQHFLLFPHCFERAFSSGLLKIQIVW